MFRTIKEQWLSAFLSELKGTREILIISPFINQVMVDHLLNNREEGTKIKMVTRYSLADFYSGASSLHALRLMVIAGAEIKGIEGLHSKVYLFDRKSAILTSANFTSGGFFNNHEFGILSDENRIIDESHAYFKNLSAMDNDVLSLDTIEHWQAELNQLAATRQQLIPLPDYGKRSARLLNQRRRFFIKFFGSDYDRVDPDYAIREMIKHSHCHYALTFSGKKGRPRKYQDGDIVYLARMLNGRDYAIFGYAVAFKHHDHLDVASPEDIEQIPWRTDWPVYIRIHSPVFADGNMGDCPTMSRLIGELKHECFDKIQRRYTSDNSNEINPWNSLIRQADVQLSEIGACWLEQELNLTFNKVGTVPAAFLKTVYTPVVERPY